MQITRAIPTVLSLSTLLSACAGSAMFGVGAKQSEPRATVGAEARAGSSVYVDAPRAPQASLAAHVTGSEPAPVTGPSTAPAQSRQGAELQASAPRLAALRPLVDGMTFVAPECAPGASEQCNGVDDDCNGQIDEGCGVEAGTLQVMLSYDRDMEIYLTVHSPVGGHRLSANENDRQFGGTFQRPRARRCEFHRTTDRTENAVWRTERLPRGTYRVEIRSYSTCGDDSITSANLQLALAVGGRPVGSYRWVQPHEQFGHGSVQVLEFDVELRERRGERLYTRRRDRFGAPRPLRAAHAAR